MATITDPNAHGVNTPTLTLSNVTAAMMGNYTVTVTDQAGPLTSDPAYLTVQDPGIDLHYASVRSDDDQWRERYIQRGCSRFVGLDLSMATQRQSAVQRRPNLRRHVHCPDRGESYRSRCRDLHRAD